MNCYASTFCGCCTLLCTTCCKSSLLLCSHLSDPVVHLHSRRSIQVSTSSRFGFFPLSSQRKSGPLLRSCGMQCKCSHPIQCWSMSLDKEDRSRILPIWCCASFSVQWCLSVARGPSCSSRVLADCDGNTIGAVLVSAPSVSLSLTHSWDRGHPRPAMGVLNVFGWDVTSSSVRWSWHSRLALQQSSLPRHSSAPRDDQ